jgi:hypothetical protein
MNMLRDAVLLTLDVDWAPDFAIDRAARILIEAGVRATWFITHESAAVDRLRHHPDLFEIGMHPNFLPGSTHGATPRDVLDHCRAIAPEAISVRTHSLVQSASLLDAMMEDPRVRVDASLYLPHATHVAPVEYWRGGRCLIRVPYVWEDDTEMDRPEPFWTVAPLAARPGLQLINFHPIHVFLNGSDFTTYRELKRGHPHLASCIERDAAEFVRSGEGPGAMFADVVSYLASSGNSWRLSDVARPWLERLS